jgi:uncharacterized protein (DUF1330 family)
MSADYPYVWVRRRRLPRRYGQRCRVVGGERDVHTDKGRSIVIEFDDGDQIVACSDDIRRKL